MFACYKNIVGLAKKDCPCTELDRPSDYDISFSGLYLDDLAPIGQYLTLGECGDTIWTVLQTAFNNATTRFVADTNALLLKHNRLRYSPLQKSVIGEIKAREPLRLNKLYGGVRIACNPIRGGVFKLNNVNTIFQNEGSFDLYLYDNVNGLLETFTVNTLTAKTSKNAIDIELPLHSNYVDVLEYYLVYAYDMDNKPMNTKIDCGCGGKRNDFNLQYPTWGNRNSGAWANYVMIAGLEFDGLTDLEYATNFSLSTSQTKGLSLEADFYCRIGDLLCPEKLNFESDNLAYSIAYAIQYASGVEIGNNVIRTSALNRETMINGDEWRLAIDEWSEKYMEHVNYIAKNVDISSTDCLICKDLFSVGKRGLFS